ncbi:phosphatidylinositol-specific phospholipase C/glycerophosphodiester phosphodiesterase family protein [Mucilaginibacter sp.]|uniref:phosphatidylinositol-specific phospholipase C/glycerophosphodiester phosphodiesterase family protein n=1 Tax=Mucilaginibacter sp. TaxID=1882438 RepID=UPI0025EA1AB5|nr:phosphatidylinositol-specific phospholipase C/glycerophosphodiester phosphodiesterase family protein [Mucilaginibacter sp.]
MPTAFYCPKHLKFLFLVLLISLGYNSYSQNLRLLNGFAHNDYWHKRPLYDALDNGFTHIEADIYLRGNKLIVAHILPIFKKQRTLERLYFKPLMECIEGNNKEIKCPVYPLTLMIDIKSDADKTYQALEILLEKYRPILSGYNNGVYTQRQVTVVITGHKPSEMIKTQQNRLAFIDEDLMQLKQDTISKNLYQTASCKYSHLLKWDGRGDFSPVEKKRLCTYVMLAHRFGKKVRLWASPENEAVWKELLNCGVDLINTDKLVELKNFLTSGPKSYAKID